MHRISGRWMNRGNSFPAEIPTETTLESNPLLCGVVVLDKLLKTSDLGRIIQLSMVPLLNGIWQEDC
jgi:hypothetical protein